MNIQIFGRSKSFDTKKAERWFKERRVKFQSIDLNRYGMSGKEFDSVLRAVGGIDNLIDWESKSPEGEKNMANYQIPEKARVAVLTGAKKIEIFELPVPEIGDDEVLVKVEQTGICGTDVHEYKGDPFGYIPVQLGHEGTGTVVKLGKNIKTDYYGKPLAVGDKIVTGLKPCGVCDTCKNDPANVHLCPAGEIFGLMPGAPPPPSPTLPLQGLVG